MKIHTKYTALDQHLMAIYGYAGLCPFTGISHISFIYNFHKYRASIPSFPIVFLRHWTGAVIRSNPWGPSEVTWCWKMCACAVASQLRILVGSKDPGWRSWINMHMCFGHNQLLDVYAVISVINHQHMLWYLWSAGDLWVTIILGNRWWFCCVFYKKICKTSSRRRDKTLRKPVQIRVEMFESKRSSRGLVQFSLEPNRGGS